MVSKIEKESSSERTKEFFRLDRNILLDQIKAKLFSLAEEIINKNSSHRVTNVILFHFLENVQNEIEPFWREEIMMTVQRQFKEEFKHPLSIDVVEASTSNFLNSFDHVFDQITKQVLRWPLDLSEDDVYKLATLIMQNIKGPMKKSLSYVNNSINNSSL
ncbi:MAG: hypothetical protein ACFFD1_10795 [Candidatus Thorarchaeota archaeon]